MAYSVPNFGPSNKDVILRQLLSGGFFKVNGNVFYGIDLVNPNNNIDAIWYGSGPPINNILPRATELSYSINNSGATRNEGFNEQSGYRSFTPLMTNFLTDAFELWDDVIATSLNPISPSAQDSSTANIALNFTSTTDRGGTYAITDGAFNSVSAPPRDIVLQDAEIWFNSNWVELDSDSDYYYGSRAVQIGLHEIGHTLGLQHGGPYDAVIAPNGRSEYFEDTNQYTVMSYFAAGANGNGTNHVFNGVRIEASTPLLNDIFTLQAVYGADFSTRQGNTTYGFNSNAGRGAFSFGINTDHVIAIWDGGGIDTIDVSGWNTNQIINLNNGTFSSVGNLTNNLAIAYSNDSRSTIENAIGGSGADVITGNNANNVLTGRGGNDTLYGNDGDDIFQISGIGDGFDIIDGGSGNDTVIATSANTVIGLNGLTGVETVSGGGFGGVSVLLSGNNDSYNFTGTIFIGVTQIDAAAGDDNIVGSTGIDKILGGFGNDTIEGGAGDDILIGGAGIDTVSYASSAFGVTVHLDNLTAQNTVQQGIDTLSGFENILGSAQDDSLWGDAGNNTITGGAGFDTIVSGGGTNILIGGADGDTYFIQGVNDVVIETAGGGYDVVLSQVNFTLAAGSEVEALAVNTTVGISLTGNEFGQTLTGNAGDDRLSGGGGNDLIISGGGINTLIGGTGDDIYYTQGVNDVVTEDVGGGFDVVLAGGNLTLTASSEVEVIAVNTTSGVMITGSNTNQTILGAGGNDRFIGGLGNDTITGSGGSDTFVLRNTFADRDFITDFASGSDKLEISAALFGGGLAAGVLSGAKFFAGAGIDVASTAAQRFIYNSSTGNLWFDADGNGAGASVLMANLSSIPTLTAADFLIAI